MSKSEQTTREKILDRSLNLFNARGIEYVGLREIAATLDIRVGNITYYFPTKDDLVNELSLELNKANSVLMTDTRPESLETFIMKFTQIFQNHLKYRCLLLSLVHLMERNPRMAARYKKTQRDRNAVLRGNLEHLVEASFLNGQARVDLEFLVSTLALVVRFWISEAQVSYRHLDPQEQIRHYVSLIATLLFPYATPSGKKQLNKVLENLKPL